MSELLPEGQIGIKLKQNATVIISKLMPHTEESIQRWLPVENEMAGFDLVW